MPGPRRKSCPANSPNTAYKFGLLYTAADDDGVSTEINKNDP